PNRYKDHALSRKAKRLALQKDGALFCYSTYASEAFRADHQLVRHRFLFQLHPHPKAVRTLLMEESERDPWARGSLTTEYELALSDREFEEMCMEPELANGWVAASSYTARTLTEQGVPSRKTHVVPYGVDAERFFERSEARSPSKKLIAVFVGSMIQRKGLSYFLDALRMLKSKHVGAVLCGRGMIDKELLSRYTDIDVEVRVGLSTEQLVKQIHRSDLFVLPSLAEGFAHVILEAMSCGVPVIATPNTCAPDVLTDGVHGFIVPIRDAEAVADKLSWAIENREQIAEMGRAAAAQARGFTWERFRTGVREAYRSMLTSA
ncbi:MAG: glycosyltransferase family 4 protein, partial [Blastocatellia bacterium]